MRTAAALGEAPPLSQAQFATVALTELVAVYMAEADLARTEAVGSNEQPKLRAWSNAVDQFVDQLLLVMEDIEAGSAVELRQLHNQVVGVVAGERTVILSHPRAQQQGAYEGQVLMEFCSGYDCRQLTAAEQQRTPIPLSAGNFTAEWTFAESGPECRHQQIVVQFISAQQLVHLRALCQQLLQEAETLAAELAWQRRHEVLILWDSLQVSATPHRPEHLIKLNRAGDSILASIPLIYSTPGLIGQLAPWLRTRYQDGGAAELVLEAATLGWQ